MDRDGWRWQDFGTLLAQARQVKGQALTDLQQEERTLYAAYREWWTSRAGQLVLEQLIGTVVLQPCADLYAEGERRLVLRILKMIREAEQIVATDD